MRWGLIAPGRIAHKFAEALQHVPDQVLHRVAGRDPGRAQAFAAQWGGQACDSVAQLCADAEVDIVYIASPHSAHAEQAALALRAGKPVLCEKSLTKTAAEAEALVALARERNVFLMEAVWTRFLPAWARVRELLGQGAIGQLRRVHSSFCFHPPYEPGSRLFDPQLAGGALLDLGVYNLSLTDVAMRAAGQGSCTHWDARGRLAPTGVEMAVDAWLQYEGGATASFACAFDGWSPNAMHLEGSEGFIELPDGFSHANRLRWRRGREDVQDELHPLVFNGFEGQIAACAEALGQGWIEHPLMPHADSLACLRRIDAMRARLGAQ